MNGSIFFLLFQDGSQLFGLVPVQHLVDVPKLEALTPGTLDKTKGPSGKPRYIFFKKKNIDFVARLTRMSEWTTA